MASFSNAGSRRDGGARQEHTFDAIQVINAFPTSLTARQADQKAKHKQDTIKETRSAPSFPTLDGSTLSNAALCKDAYQIVWDAMHTQLQAVLDSMLDSTFTQLADFATQGHQRITTDLDRQCHPAIPTALVATGGANAADHAHTFTKLATHLKARGMRTALLKPHDFQAQAGKSTSNVLNRVLRQLSGLDTTACDMQACVAWYADFIGRTNTSSSETTAAHPGSPPSTNPSKSPRTDTKTSPRGTGRGGGGDTAGIAGAAAASPGNTRTTRRNPRTSSTTTTNTTMQQQQQGAHPPPRRTRGAAAPVVVTDPPATPSTMLRTLRIASPSPSKTRISPRGRTRAARAGSDTTTTRAGDGGGGVKRGGGGAMKKDATPQQGGVGQPPQQAQSQQAQQHLNTEDPTSVPLVVVIERLEAIDLAVLHPLLLLLHEAMAQLPITLILGMSTSPSCFLKDLPVDAVGLLTTTTFILHKASRLYEEIVSQVLLGRTWPGVVFSGNALDMVHAQFVYHDFCANAVCKGLQVACMQHAMQEPTSCVGGVLLGEGVSGVARMVQSMSSRERQQLLQCMKLPHTATGAAAEGHIIRALQDVQSCWSGWAVVLHWLSEAGEVACTQHGTNSEPYKLRTLLREYSHPLPCAAVNDQTLTNLRAMLRRLDDGAARALVRAMLQRVDRVWGGVDVMSKYTAMLKALLTDTPAQHTTRGGRGSQNTAPGGQGGRGTPAAAAGNKTTSNVTTDGAGAATAGAAGVLSRDALQQLRKHAQQRQPLVSRHDVMQHAVGNTHGQQSTSIAKALADVLVQAAEEFLTTPPACMPAAAPLCCQGRGLRSLLSGAPRAALHKALTTGAPLGPAVRQQESQGVGPCSEDAAIAYQLLLQVGERIDAAQWFEGFCQVHGASAIRGGEGLGPAGAPSSGRGPSSEGGRKAAGTQQGHKQGGVREVLSSFAKRYKAKRATTATTSVASTEGATRFALLPVEDRQAQLRVLAARFSCAVAELQLAGVCRQSKQRRRGVVVQRTMYLPPLLVMGSSV